jgi:hypothetical protein
MKLTAVWEWLRSVCHSVNSDPSGTSRSHRSTGNEVQTESDEPVERSRSVTSQYLHDLAKRPEERESNEVSWPPNFFV